MINVSNDFTTESTNTNRFIIGQVTIDWNKDGTYTDESAYLKLVEVERMTQEPLGGVQLAQMDIILDNSSDRYTPGNTGDLNGYLFRGRPGKGYVGFTDEYLNIFKGKSDVPQITRNNRECRIHFLDELQVLDEYKLSGGGELFLDIRTDRYIWDILDEVYSGYFTVIASCNSDETWTDGELEQVNQRGGDGCRKVTSTTGTLEDAYTEPASPLDLSGYSADDSVYFFCYIDDSTKATSVMIRLETTAGSAYYYKEISTLLTTGWNEVGIKKSEFSVTGSPNWNSIARITLIVDATGSDTIYCIFDEIRIADVFNYPQRWFDVGLQNIPTAWWAGNTSLYEIKTASESESARFYADENGDLRFENRQHYNNNAEHKVSVHGFTFNRMTDFYHPNKEQDVINRVNIVVKPRVVSTEIEIWRYPFVVAIAAGATREIWASFADPCPTTATGIVTPEITTDYLANTQADGLGTDKSDQLSLSITKFTDSSLLEVTNGDAGTVYLTLLKLRGTPAMELDPVKITAKDDTSIANYGEYPLGGLNIDNKYLADEVYSQTLADGIVATYKNPMDRIVLTSKAIPQLQVGDMVSVTNEDIVKNYLMRIYWIKTGLSTQEGMVQEIKCRAVQPMEILTFFEIGTSLIESTDVIAP